LPVYDAEGKRLNGFSVVEAVLLIDGVDPESIPTEPKEYGMTVRGERLYFPSVQVGRGVRVTLRNDRGDRVTSVVELYDCRQRFSLRHGQLWTGSEAPRASIHGRVAGCSLDGDWWIRAMPMFGDQFDQFAIHEGVIDRDTGAFRISGFSKAVRQIVTIGKDNKPVTSFGANVAEGADNDGGTINLSGSCPGVRLSLRPSEELVF
jgi:hypothetical protein